MKNVAKRYLVGLSLMAGVFSTVASVFYFPDNGHWYQPVRVPEGIVWTNAYAAAINSGGYLCTITNAAENNFVASLVDASYYSDVSINNDILGPWLGGFRNANESQWQWVTGEPFNYTDWYPGQPDGYGGSDQKVQYYARATIGSTWGDHPGNPIPGYSLPRGYIIEFNQPPLSATLSNQVVTVSGPQLPVGWNLETTPSLSNPAWTIIPSTQLQLTATGFFLNVTNPVGMAFFRLRSN